MQWLAELCVKRPVFATVLILSLTVVGAFSFIQLGVDRYPEGRHPDDSDHDGAARRGARADRDRGHRQDRGGGQHDQRHRRAAVDLVGRRVDRHRRLPAREGRRHRGAGSARQGQRHPAAAAENDRAAARGSVRSRRCSRAEPRARRRSGRFARSPSTPTRSSAGSSRASKASARCSSIGGRSRQINITLDADRLRAYNVTVTDVSRALNLQNAEIPGGRMDQGPQSVTLRTRGRVQSVGEFNDIVVKANQTHPVRIADVGQVEDGMADADTDREHRRHRHGAAERAAAVRHEHRRGGQEHQGAHRGNQEGAAARLRSAHRSRHVGVHRSVDPQRRGTPHRRLASSRRSSCCCS